MDLARTPSSGLAAEVLPPSLHAAVTHVFSHGVEGAMLAGGTALAGYYAGHRRSDDLDVFAGSALAYRAAVLSVKSLREIGCSLADERSSARFYHATCRLRGHGFTVQVVLDSNLFAVGVGIKADDGVVVADLDTLLKMKAATLVSRASEKDLFDLSWFFAQAGQLDVPTLIALGQQIDGGVNAEAVLVNLVGTPMRESACGFSVTKNPAEVFAEVARVRKGLIQGVERHLRSGTAPPIARLLRKLT